MTQNEGDGSSEIGKLSVEGKKDDETAADGSIVSVEAGAKFVMTTGVTLSRMFLLQQVRQLKTAVNL